MKNLTKKEKTQKTFEIAPRCSPGLSPGQIWDAGSGDWVGVNLGLQFLLGLQV